MMFVSYAKTAQEFRDEIAKDLRREAEREGVAKIHAHTKREAELAYAREVTLTRYAAFLESVTFTEKREELTRTGDEAQPDIDFGPEGFKAVSKAGRNPELTSDPFDPSKGWP